MKEAIGATFIIKIMIVFLVLYNSLLAIAVNYAIAFRVKNEIINILSEYEGCENAGERVKEYVNTIGYYRARSANDKGYDIQAIQTDRGTYYKVTTFIVFDFPWIRDLLRIGVSGETKVIFGEKESQEHCSNI